MEDQTSGIFGGWIAADTTNNRAKYKTASGLATTVEVYFSFQYVVQ